MAEFVYQKKTVGAGLPAGHAKSGMGHLEDRRARVVLQGKLIEPTTMDRPLTGRVSHRPVQRKTFIENRGQPCAYGSATDPSKVAVGHTMHAWLDPANPLRGQSASVNTSQDGLMAWIKQIYPLAAGPMSVKGHLLNDNLGGTALDINLYPISKGANGKHLSTAENFVKNAVWQEGKAVKYSVEVAGSGDYTGADASNAQATFKTTVSEWDDVNDQGKVGKTIYNAAILSDLGKPKDRQAIGADGTSLGNISGYGLSAPIKPAETVGELSTEEKNIRGAQPAGLGIEAVGAHVEYSDLAGIMTASGAPGDEVVLEKAWHLLNDSPCEFVEEYIDDASRSIVDEIMDQSPDVDTAQSMVGELLDTFMEGLPLIMSSTISTNDDLGNKCHDALMDFIQERYEFHDEAMDD